MLLWNYAVVGTIAGRGAIDFLEVVVSHGSLRPSVQEHGRFKFQVVSTFQPRRRVGFSEPARLPFSI